MRRLYGELLDNHLYSSEGYQNILKEFVDAGIVTINYSEKKIEFHHENGKPSRIFLRHAHRETDVYQYTGSEIQVLVIDEATTWTSKMLKYMRTRVRMGSVDIDYKEVRKKLPFVYDGYFPRIIYASNPGSVGAPFFKKNFIDPAPPMTVFQATPEDGGMRRIFIPSKLSDNTKLMENDPMYANRVLGLGGAHAKALLEGDWNAMGDGVFEDVWSDDIHIIKPIVIPENAYVVRSLDWGSWHPYAVIYTLILRGEVVETVDGEELYFQPDSQIVFHEMYGWNGNENEGSRESAYDIGRKIAKYEATVPFRDSIRNGPADNQIFQNRGGIHATVHDLIVDGYNDMMGELAKEDKSLHSPAMQNLFKRADQSTNSRIQGLNLMRTYMMGAVTGESKGLYFTDSCRHCIRTIPSLPRSETNPEDVDTKSEDHCYDVVRYNCLATRSTFKALEIVGL